jgi:Protein of unknwon function (DUF3310)
MTLCNVCGQMSVREDGTCLFEPMHARLGVSAALDVSAAARYAINCRKNAGHDGPHDFGEVAVTMQMYPSCCDVCGEIMSIPPPVTLESNRSLRCPYLNEEWHKEAAKDATKQHQSLHLQRRRKGPVKGISVGFMTVCPPPAVETVNHPSHYGGDTPHETIKCLEAWGLERDALLWNAVKYIARSGKKFSALEDLQKAAWYLSRRIEQLKSAVPVSTTQMSEAAASPTTSTTQPNEG